MYADDCILFISGNDLNRMLHKIQPEVNSVQKWCVSNRLKINESKSKVILFGSRQKLGPIDYSIQIILGTSSLNYCNKYKYLGVTLDSEMKLTTLLADTRKTVSNRLFNLEN